MKRGADFYFTLRNVRVQGPFGVVLRLPTSLPRLGPYQSHGGMVEYGRNSGSPQLVPGVIYASGVGPVEVPS